MAGAPQARPPQTAHRPLPTSQARADVKKRRIAVVGLGKLGHKCAEALLADQTLTLAGVVRRNAASVDWLGGGPVVGHPRELNDGDAAPLCVAPHSAQNRR